MSEAHQADEVTGVLATLPYRNERPWGLLPRRDQEFLDAIRAVPVAAIAVRDVRRLRAIRDWLRGR